MKETPKDCHCIHCDDNQKPKQSKSAYDMTDEEVVKVVDPFLDTSDFNDDGSDIETWRLGRLRDIMEGNYDN